MQNSKDKTMAFAIKQFVNYKMKEQGIKVEDFNIDSINKNLEITVYLPEIQDLLTLKANNYEITTKNGKYFLEVEEIEKSKQWNNHYIDGKRYKIPNEVLKIIEFVL
jgi:hypothetical protein